MVLERPDYASKKRIEKRLLYADGRQRCAYLGMVDDNGAFLYMCDTGEAEHLRFHSQAALIAMYEAERDAALEEVAAIKTLYSAQEDYINDLTRLIKRSLSILDDALPPDRLLESHEAANVKQKKTRYRDAVAKKVVLDDDE